MGRERLDGYQLKLMNVVASDLTDRITSYRPWASLGVKFSKELRITLPMLLTVRQKATTIQQQQSIGGPVDFSKSIQSIQCLWQVNVMADEYDKGEIPRRNISFLYGYLIKRLREVHAPLKK
ncbi:MAG: hypothetical protein LBQ00_06915 [Syntrophobacterales bacterium]|jgi:hypothetical protein|nr:hypothetical protein [Syntrophobacterales bacterium]